MDTLLRAINQPETVRVVAAITTEAVREACRRQQASGAAAVVIGRALSCGVLLATLAKRERERIRIHLRGGGEIGSVMIDAYGNGRVRACLERPPGPSTLPENGEGRARASIAEVVGRRGEVVVTRDLGLAHPYQGMVELQTGEIDEDLQHYLDHSEQLPSALRSEILLDGQGAVVRAVGVLAQAFPGSDPELIGAVRERFAGDLLAQLVVGERSVDELVGFALGGQEFRRMAEYPIEFHCPCGPERAISVLSTLGAADLAALADEQDTTEVRCNFCGRVTTLSAAEVRELASTLRAHRS